MLRSILAASSLIISVGLWLPSQIRILKTKKAQDYSPWSFAFILWLQISSFILASLDHSRSLQWYFAINGANVGIMLALILRFR
jgi:hypothetical protein